MKRPSRAQLIREEILREWRGCDEPENPDAGIQQASRLVSSILRASGLEDGLTAEEVRSAWLELAGEFIARHTEPVSVRNGHLVLHVTQPAMRFHLEQMKPVLLNRICSILGADRIKSVKFTLG